VIRRRPAAAGASTLRFRSVTRWLAATACLGGLAASAVAARGPLAAAASELGNQRPLPFALAAVLSLLVPFATAGAWRSVLASRGERLSVCQVWGCYGFGALANAVLPARLGEVVRIELFSRQLVHHPGRRPLAYGTSALVALGQSISLSAVLVIGVMGGALPPWAIAPSVGLPIVLFGARSLAARRGARGAVSDLLAATTLSSSAWARLLCWIAGSALVRLMAVAAVLDAVGARHVLSAAVVAVGARAVGNAVPFAPGGAGVTAAAMAVGLSHAGLDTTTALAAALSYHGLETLGALLFGGCGCLMMRLAHATVVRERSASLGTLGAAAAVTRS
jgi:uncharacterized membrane protein YbhN (UPF0104 family)